MSKLFVKSFLIVALAVGCVAHAANDKTEGETGQKSDLELLKECCKAGAKCDLNDPQMKKAMETFLQGQGVTAPKPAK